MLNGKNLILRTYGTLKTFSELIPTYILSRWDNGDFSFEQLLCLHRLRFRNACDNLKCARHLSAWSSV